MTINDVPFPEMSQFATSYGYIVNLDSAPALPLYVSYTQSSVSSQNLSSSYGCFICATNTSHSRGRCWKDNQTSNGSRPDSYLLN